jgi:hypothetical protein
MRISVTDYHLNKKAAQDWFLKNGEGNFNNSVSIIACSSMVPCIVVAFWLGEVAGWNEEVLAKINMLTKFYGYTYIEGIPDSYPKGD